MKKIGTVYKESVFIRVSSTAGSSAILLYIINRLYLKNLFEWTFIQHYFNDVLAGVLIVAMANVFAVIGGQRRLLLISFVRILVFTFVCGVFWEYVTPLYLAYSVSDPLDVFAYMVGGTLYWGIIRLMQHKVSANRKG